MLTAMLALAHPVQGEPAPPAPRASAGINWGSTSAAPAPGLSSTLRPAPPRAPSLTVQPAVASPVAPSTFSARQPPGNGAHTLAQGSLPELKTPRDLTNLTDSQPVRFEGRNTTIKALRESSTMQVLRGGSPAMTQATWTRTVHGQGMNTLGTSPAGQWAAANAALRQSVEGAGPGNMASTLLRPSGGAISIQHCNGVDYTTRTTRGATSLTGPQLLNLKQSHIGPGGAVVLNGLCFGATPGRVRLIGNFPGGQLLLSTPVWRHDVVYAEIPQLNGVASHQVVVQLLDARGVLSNELPGTWEAPPQILEVDSARVWEIVQCDSNQAPFDAVCRSGAQLLQSLDAKPLFGIFLAQHTQWLAESLPATAIGALHRRVDLDKPVEPFQGRDVYRLRAPAGCVAEKTFWSPPNNAPATGITATHLDERTVAVDWRADFCVKYGWALDHDWSCVGSYMSRKTVISCPAGTALP
ncbi:hypothetical protein J7U46_00040 [Pelomonas sp. V22]|uniref:hypothetical protein n=1 Tax=Pelomonas sp. V22 TaxID=2822139 RepID=UPI0024A8D055|nr:hypothetical protein [Pelomonas sp. V22]MDI4631430.1 hypothetical protein [Pelomonas sp. V22]